MSQSAYCLGVIKTVVGPSSPFQCYADTSYTTLGNWVYYNTTLPFDASQIDPQVVAAMFGGGFVLFVTPWAAAWGASQMLKLLR